MTPTHSTTVAPDPSDYESVLADHRRLVRELDVLLNGEAAAEQASLCDIVAQLSGVKRLDVLRAALAVQVAPAAEPASRFVVTDMGYCNRTNECECAPEAMRGCVSWVAAATSLEPAIELRGVAETLNEGNGFWRSCSGCHESNEGHATGPYSATLRCHIGNGCSECGGLGAVWDDTDYAEMAEFMNGAAASPASSPALPAPVGGPQLSTDERAEFETWARGRYAASIPHEQLLYIEPDKTTYFHAEIKFAWLGWQARAELASRSPA